MTKKIILVFFFTLFTTTAFSLPDRTYDVQVLIFSHLTPDTLQSEKWPALSSNTVNAFNQNATVTQTTQSADQLQKEKKALEKNPHYQILLDSSWKETWNGDQSTITIPIANNSDNNGQLNGNITIALSHYFDVNAHLLLTEPLSVLQKIDAHGYFSRWDQSHFSFEFMQNRRMRSNELNYLNHPLLGVLIKIIPA